MIRFFGCFFSPFLVIFSTVSTTPYQVLLSCSIVITAFPRVHVSGPGHTPLHVCYYLDSQLPSSHTLRISKSRFIVALLSACARLSIRSWIKSYSQRILVFRSNVALIGWCRYMTLSWRRKYHFILRKVSQSSFMAKVAWNLNSSAEPRS